MEKRAGTINRIAARLPFVTAVVGMALTFGAVVFFYGGDDVKRIAMATVGQFLLLLGIWFAAHPYVISTRRYLPLRREVNAFLELVKRLNAAKVAGAHDTAATIRLEMEQSVARMEDLAGRTDDD